MIGDPIKRGLKTSEFWVVAGPMILAGLHTLGVNIAADSVLTLAEGAGVAYAGLRTILKVVHIKALERLGHTLSLVEANAGTLVTQAAPVVETVATDVADAAATLKPPAAVS